MYPYHFRPPFIPVWQTRGGRGIYLWVLGSNGLTFVRGGLGWGKGCCLFVCGGCSCACIFVVSVCMHACSTKSTGGSSSSKLQFKHSIWYEEDGVYHAKSDGAGVDRLVLRDVHRV